MRRLKPKECTVLGKTSRFTCLSALAGAFLVGSTFLAGCSETSADGDIHDDKEGGGSAKGEGSASGDGDGDGDGETGSGSASGSGGSGDLEDLEEVASVGTALSCDEDGPLSPGPLLKLSTVQYRNTVRDLLGRLGLTDSLEGVEALLAVIPDDSLGDSFRALDDRVAIEHVQGFFNVGVYVGDALVADLEALRALAGDCASEETLSDTCWNDFLSKFMFLVHRRPLKEVERELYDSLNDGESTPVESLRAAVIVALSSPRFLYQVETEGETIGEREDLLRIGPYELASRLSYTFWQTMPDEELFALAQDGSLLEEDVYEQQLQRVWEDPRARETLQQFWTEWLKLEKFTGFETTRPGFQALTEGEFFGQEGHDYYADMVQEVHDLTQYFTFDEPGTLSELLSTQISVTQSADLASLYGIEPWDGEGDYPTLSNRAGLLQRGALIVSNLEHTNPFHRGALIRRHILCDPLPQPSPNDLPPGSLDPPPVDEAQSTRERFAAKVEGNTLCEGCHKGFSSIGYTMESFDAVGRYREVERVFDEQNGDLLAELPIDTSGLAGIVSQSEEPVADAAEMNQVIIDSGKVEVCLAERYFSYLQRRAMVSSSLDACVVEDMSRVLKEEEGGLAVAFQRLAQVPTFFTRKVGEQ